MRTCRKSSKPYNAGFSYVYMERQSLSHMKMLSACAVATAWSATATPNSALVIDAFRQRCRAFFSAAQHESWAL